jgi:CubicO group peptidase (beta-lactamase class C family)
MAIVSGGNVVYAKGFGKRDVKNDLPVTTDTLFAIGSCTKAFTTFVLGQLVDEGKLDWDKPVGRYLPGFRLYDTVASNELTPRDLVTHRSGLPRHDLVWYNNQTLTRKDIVERLQYLPPNAELREKWQYNNLMFLTAGYLIEQLTGKAWEAAVRERIFQPVGMTHSNFADADSQKTTDFARPYREDHDKLLEIPFREVGNMGPAGSIDSTAGDMAKWMLVQLGDAHNDLIQKSTLRTLHTPQMTLGVLPEEPELGPPSYAMGWFVDSYRGHLRVQHGGNIDGFSALVTLFPNDDTGIVVLSNASGTALPGILTFHAADRLFKAEAKDWNGIALARRKAGKEMNKEAEAKKNAVRKPGTKPAHALADYAGDYENSGYGVIRIGRSGEALSVSYNGLNAPLEHWHYETFNALKNDDPTMENTKFTFETDVNGTVSALSVVMDPLVPAAAFAKKPDAKMSDPAWLKTFTGSYSLGPQTVDVSLHGNQIVLSIPGQPSYTLTPALEDWFELKGLNGYRMKFDAAGKEITFSQPEGVYTAKRK